MSTTTEEKNNQPAPQNPHLDAVYKAAHSLLESATKFSLIVCISVLALAFLIVVAFNVHDQQIVLGVKEAWASVSLLIVGFYFGQKGLPPAPTKAPDLSVTLPTQQAE